MEPYNHKQIEPKWQDVWEKSGVYQAGNEESLKANKKKFYALIEFPYPSGSGLHVGHIRSNTAMDIIARKRRAEGYDVLFPIGWDAFGLPTENYAIKTGVSPQEVTQQNTDTFRRQLKSIGFSFDWSREINTTDPAYYKWTQWIFLQMYKHGLAYKKEMAINWCPKDKIGLANEEVVDGKCERCGTAVEKRDKEQWMLAITKYAQRLHDDLDTVDYIKPVIAQQKNWIGPAGDGTFHLRDWVFSRQRYWGEPIPMIHCESCGWQPVPEDQLPVVLPEVEKYEPTDTGESPLSLMTEWVKTTCPKCGGVGRRETDTMPNWAGSSWYYLRYADPHNADAAISKEAAAHWLPVDWYNGGMEHTTLHVLYSRFWHKFLFDIGVVPTAEPYRKRTSHGMILGEGGVKMSKSIGNVINPDDIVEVWGADTLRLYEMFMGPFDQMVAWSTDSIIGPRRFIERVWNLSAKVSDDASRAIDPLLNALMQKTIKKIGDDIENMSFNTAVSSLMILTNEMEKQESVSRDSYLTLVRLLAPFVPHVTEELWQRMGGKESVHVQPWPQADMAGSTDVPVTVAVQVNGKTRTTITVTNGVEQPEVEQAARAAVAAQLEGKMVKMTVYVKGRIVNFVLEGGGEE